MSKNNIKFSDGVGFDTSGTVYHSLDERMDGTLWDEACYAPLTALQKAAR